MSTWGVHLRIAEYFIDKIQGIDPWEFVAGSVAPDCGYGKKDSFGEFTPPPSVTHWTPSGLKLHCLYKDFYKKHLIECNDIKAYSFYLGYYIHLLTDVVWSSRIFLPTKEKYKKEYEKDPKFLLTIKKDWNDLDFKFLIENPDFRTFRLLDEKNEVRHYLPYYEPDQLTIQCRFIVNFYKESIKTAKPYREYKYFTAEEQNNFINSVTAVIETDMMKKNIINEEGRLQAI